MDEEKINDFNKHIRDVTINLCDGNPNNNKDDNYWWRIAPLLYLFSNQPQNNTLLEKEVAYMRGKLDVLEKIVLKKISE